MVVRGAALTGAYEEGHHWHVALPAKHSGSAATGTRSAAYRAA